MPAYPIAEMNWRDFEAAAKRTDLCLVPSGAVETYGPQLPTGSDGLLAAHLARAVADEVSCFVAPLVPVGVSASLAEFPGTLTVTTDAFRGYMAGVVESLHRGGVRRILFLNGHAGNVPVIGDLVAQLKPRHPSARYAQIDCWRFLAPIAKPLSKSSFPEGHAGETGTSVLLAIAPRLVRPDRHVHNPPPAAVYPDVIRYESYRDRAPDGVIGDSTPGSADAGREILAAAIARITAFVSGPDFA
jgi:creatinine amidohydrolase